MLKGCLNVVRALSFSVALLPLGEALAQSYPVAYRIKDLKGTPVLNFCYGQAELKQTYMTLDEAKAGLRTAATRVSGGEGTFLEAHQNLEYLAYPYRTPPPQIHWGYGYQGQSCSSGEGCCNTYLAPWTSAIGPGSMIYTVSSSPAGFLEAGTCEFENQYGDRISNSIRGYEAVMYSGVVCPSEEWDYNVGVYNSSTEQFGCTMFYCGPSIRRSYYNGTTLLRVPAAMCVNTKQCDVQFVQVSVCMALTGPGQVEPGRLLPGMVFALTNCSTGEPLVGAGVSASVDVDPSSGGHTHASPNRPKGGLGAAATVGPGTTVLNGTTDSNGEFAFQFVAPALAGTHTITATCSGNPSCNSATPARLSIDVRVNDLLAIPISPYYTTSDTNGSNIGDNGKHNGKNHYLTSQASAILADIGLDYAISLSTPTSPRLYLNDASLPWGGLFDFDVPWTTPHVEHRRGSVVDIRANNQQGAIPSEFFLDFEIIARNEGASAEIHNANTQYQHFHVRLLNRKE